MAKTVIPTSTYDIIVDAGWRSINNTPEEAVVVISVGEDRMSEFSLNKGELTALIESLQATMVTAQQGL
jgi:6-phosphogluconolactonase (cycloisomerase 2 family)